MLRIQGPISSMLHCQKAFVSSEELLIALLDVTIGGSSVCLRFLFPLLLPLMMLLLDVELIGVDIIIVVSVYVIWSVLQQARIRRRAAEKSEARTSQGLVARFAYRYPRSRTYVCTHRHT